MDALTAPEIAAVVTRFEALVADLEHDLQVRPLYTIVLLAQAFAGTKKTPVTPEHIRTFLALAHRLLPIRQLLLPHEGRWAPLTDVVEIIHSEVTRLASLYGVARPAYRTCNRTVQQEFRTSFTQATGNVYHPYGPTKTAKESTAITTFWGEAFCTALASFTATSDVAALDRVLACLPAWVTCHQGRWHTHEWREPSVKAVMQVFQDALQVCEVGAATITQIAGTVLEQAPVVGQAHMTQDVAQQYTAPIHDLREQLSALPRPKDTPKAQHAQLRKAHAQLQQELDALLSAQEAAIQRQGNMGTHYRHKLAMLAKKASGQRDTLLRRVGKESVEGLSRLLWIYDYDRQSDEDWVSAKQDARRFFRTLRRAQTGAGQRRKPAATSCAPCVPSTAPTTSGACACR